MSAFVESVAERAPDLQAALPGSGLEWLRDVRKQHMDAFLRDGLPQTHDEAWKYTSLRAFERKPCGQHDSRANNREVDRQMLRMPGVDGPRMVFVHGVFRPDLSRWDDCPEGIELVPVSQALSTNADDLKTAFAKSWSGRADAFARLNAALAAEGMLVRVAPGAKIQEPLHLVHVGLADDEVFAWHLLDVIDIGAGAELKLVEHHLGDGPCKHLATRVADVRLGESAELDWVIVQEAGTGQQLIRRTHMQLAEDARASVHAVELGGGLVRHDLHAELQGDRAHLDTRGLFVPHGRQHVDTRIQIRHQARDSSSDALWRGVADQRGRGVLHGAIVVEPGADGTDASLNNKNLLLSPHAEIDSQPVLEIYADEVMAAHGATVGQLDEQALFFLRARGIPEQQARAMLTTAFCQAALDSMGNKELREYCAASLLDVLPVASA